MFITSRNIALFRTVAIPKNHSRAFATQSGSDSNWYKTLGIVPDVIDEVSPSLIPLKVIFDTVVAIYP